MPEPVHAVGREHVSVLVLDDLVALWLPEPRTCFDTEFCFLRMLRSLCMQQSVLKPQVGFPVLKHSSYRVQREMSRGGEDWQGCGLCMEMIRRTIQYAEGRQL